MSTVSDPDRIIIFDTTLRDGEQSPGASMNLEEKVRIAQVLEDMGVDVIEAGFPISSPGDFDAVHEIAKQIKSSTVCGLAPYWLVSRVVKKACRVGASAVMSRLSAGRRGSR